MLASLPMYDLPEMRDATNAFWAALAKNLGVNIPLSRKTDWFAPWHNPDLLFSQTCGYPFTHAFKDQLSYVATPHYNADGCDGPFYRSILFARAKQQLAAFEGQTVAFNSRDSMSGMLALKLVFAPIARNGHYFANTIETGGHFASLVAVQQKTADICAIDCVTVAYARRYRPTALEGLVEIARSPQVPGLPYVTRGGNVQELQEALQAVMSDNALSEVRDALLLSGHSILPPNAYNSILTYEAAMKKLGGLDLF
jgi:ABC-type phosphate/phosphonate transport system substrate-binding protein